MIAPNTVPQRVTPTIGLDEAAKLLRCHPNTVREKAKAGELPGTKVGRAWVFYEARLLEWLDARMRQPPKAKADADPGASLAESIAAHRRQRAAQRHSFNRRPTGT